MLNKNLFYNLFIIILLALMQVFVFSNIYFFHRYNPIVYIIWILFVPININRYLFLILSFILGFIVDLFLNTGGINAFACVFIAQLRIFYIRFISGLSLEIEIFSFKDFNFIQLFLYIFLMVLTHHLFAFTLENFKFSNILLILKDISFTSILSTLFILILFAFTRNKIEES